MVSVALASSCSPVKATKVSIEAKMTVRKGRTSSANSIAVPPWARAEEPPQQQLRTTGTRLAPVWQDGRRGRAGKVVSHHGTE